MKKVTKSDARVSYFFNTMDRISYQLEALFEDHKPLFNGERYITNKELSKYLKIHERTLSDYRKCHAIPYIYFGGKVLYKETEIQKLLDAHYIPKWR